MRLSKNYYSRITWVWGCIGAWISWGCLSGCALGKAELRVVHLSSPPSLLSTPVPDAISSTLTAPSSEPTKVPLTPVATYKVQPGDSLWRIARHQWGSSRWYLKLGEWNQLSKPDLIQPGQVLRLDIPAVSTQQPTPGPVKSSTTVSVVPPLSGTPSIPFPRRPQKNFYIGESLTFSVEYFAIAAGFATLSVEEGPWHQGRPTYLLVASAKTHPAFEWMFKVRDRIISHFDKEGLFSWQYEKHLREGGYSNDSVLIYDQINHQVIKDEGRTKVPAPAWTQDVLSEFYFFRSLAFNVGDKVTIPVVADDGKSYELIVEILRTEKYSGPTGTYDCIVVRPTLKFEGLFQQKGEILIWLTNDKRRIPVLIKSKIAIGTIDIVLRDATVVTE
jgi:LysM repeat protein